MKKLSFAISEAIERRAILYYCNAFACYLIVDKTDYDSNIANNSLFYHGDNMIKDFSYLAEGQKVKCPKELFYKINRKYLGIREPILMYEPKVKVIKPEVLRKRSMLALITELQYSNGKLDCNHIPIDCFGLNHTWKECSKCGIKL